ncbi:aminoacyl-histidine dipeptidase [Parendozoicomonas haliclonae]|uniref:Cytosol non-specific dipeptidase n=1 Tax=Parendozoicomonas haliclonae TaxID=1960125 RepID=A0A1X7AMF0_9GAMM|nr:aminoacyl-histidine dipeptidase [Parendozoicomonas haliclonae]SMA49094.1 Cytosol non-specific dipeptidase [Parendozoicomonas haliclonae]
MSEHQSDIKQLAPAAVWQYFHDICQIPHPSGEEEALRNYVLNFAAEHKLEAEVDAVGNVVVRKPATPGMENRFGVVLQGHLDMVPQKNEDTDHNFSTDPIQPWIDGEWVKARGTTLGSDNGMGVAASLAVLASTDLEHGPVEALFTIDEERSMVGAEALQPGWLKGDILLNLDTEEEGELYVGCAGGVDVDASASYEQEATPADSQWFRIAVKGLKGGHSGCDIHLQRGNANKILVSLLKELSKLGVRVGSIRGGSLSNAIPREAFATVAVPADQIEAVNAAMDHQQAIARNLLAATDAGVTITAENCEAAGSVMAARDQQIWLDAFHAVPNGVDRMSESVEGVVETSNNFAIMNVAEGKVVVNCFARSLVDDSTSEIGERIAGLLRLAGADVALKGQFPGWQPNMDSPILAAMQETYMDVFGKQPEIKVIHAGLECGILGSAYPNWDMISIGPTICFPHSPDEMVHIASVEKFWTLLTASLARVPVKA